MLIYFWSPSRSSVRGALHHLPANQCSETVMHLMNLCGKNPSPTSSSLKRWGHYILFNTFLFPLTRAFGQKQHWWGIKQGFSSWALYTCIHRDNNGLPRAARMATSPCSSRKVWRIMKNIINVWSKERIKEQPCYFFPHLRKQNCHSFFKLSVLFNCTERHCKS